MTYIGWSSSWDVNFPGMFSVRQSTSWQCVHSWTRWDCSTGDGQGVCSVLLCGCVCRGDTLILTLVPSVCGVCLHRGWGRGGGWGYVPTAGVIISCGWREAGRGRRGGPRLSTHSSNLLPLDFVLPSFSLIHFFIHFDSLISFKQWYQTIYWLYTCFPQWWFPVSVVTILILHSYTPAETGCKEWKENGKKGQIKNK